jgi:hypothetical protein
LDGDVLLLGAALFALTIAAIWASPARMAMHALRRASVRRTVAMRVMFVLVFLALMPSVYPYDHLLVPAVDAHEGAHAASDERVHASHCHGTAASCADAPVSSGPGHFLANTPLMPVPTMVFVLIVTTALAWTGITRRPDLRPPLFASSAT